MTDGIAKLASISIDCPDADALAAFYSRLLGLTEFYAAPDRSFIALRGAGTALTLMRVDEYEPPVWPGGPQRQQMHLDLSTRDLDASVAAAVELGAVEAQVQPSPQRWRVLLDPAGHPFCLTTMGAE